MRPKALQIGGSGVGGAVRRAVLIAAILYLALVQVLSAAHALSGEANAPNHHNSACAICVAAHGASCGSPVGEVELPAPPAVSIVLTQTAESPLHAVRLCSPSPRGPPSV